MAIEIVDFPIKNGGSFHCYVIIFPFECPTTTTPMTRYEPNPPADNSHMFASDFELKSDDRHYAQTY